MVLIQGLNHNYIHKTRFLVLERRDNRAVDWLITFFSKTTYTVQSCLSGLQEEGVMLSSRRLMAENNDDDDTTSKTSNFSVAILLVDKQ